MKHAIRLKGFQIVREERRVNPADPTIMTIYTIRTNRPNWYDLRIEEFFGDWYLYNETLGTREGPLTEQQCSQLLRGIGRPTIGAIDKVIYQEERLAEKRDPFHGHDPYYGHS